MKKYLKIFALCLMVGILTTGCVDANIKMNIGSDKNMDFNMNLSMDLSQIQDLMESMGGSSNEEMTDEEYFACLEENDGDESKCVTNDSSSNYDMDEITNSIDEEELKELENKGFTVTQNKSGNKYEVNVSKKYGNIDNLSKNESFTVKLSDISNENFDNKFFTVKKGLLEDTYELHMIIESESDTENNGLEVDSNSMFDSSMLSNMITFTYQITLPNESISNNATNLSTDKKTLTWTLSPTNQNEINVSFSLPSNNKNMIVYGGIGIGFLIILIILILVIKRIGKKRKNKANQNNDADNSQQSIKPAEPMPMNNEQVNVQHMINQSIPMEPMNLANSQPVPMGTVPINNQNMVQPMNVVNDQSIPMESTPINNQSVVQPINVVNDQPIPMETASINNQNMVQPMNVVSDQPIPMESAPINDQSVVQPMNVVSDQSIPMETAPINNQNVVQPMNVVNDQSVDQSNVSNNSITSENEPQINQELQNEKINNELQDVAMDILNNNNK